MKVMRASYRVYDVPETWEEGEEMLTHAMRNYDGRGSNATLLSVCTRVAFGMFGEAYLAADPTQALCFVLQRVCQREGAGLGDPK